MALLHSHNVQVHEVTVHLPVPRRRVPATHSQDLQALHRLVEALEKKVTLFFISTKDTHESTVIADLIPKNVVKDAVPLPSSPCSVAGEAPGGDLCFQAGCALGAYSQSARAHCLFSYAYRYLQLHTKRKCVSVSHVNTDEENIARGAVPPRSPSVKILRNDSELQSTPL